RYSLGARNPRQIFLFRFSMDISAVFHLYSQGGRIILMDAQKNFILRDHFLCDLKHQPQPFRGVSPPPVLRSYTIPDMAGAVSQKIIEAVAEIENPHILSILIFQNI